MTPLKLLAELESHGLRVGVRHGVLHVGPPGKITAQQREIVGQNKTGLIAVITHQCLECNQPLRIQKTDNVAWLVCPTDPLHFNERMGVLETIECPGEQCGRNVELRDGVGWCDKHKMTVRLT